MFEFDFLSIAIGLAILSLGIAGISMAGSGIFGEEVAARAKKNIINTILGVVIAAIAGTLITNMFGGLM